MSTDLYQEAMSLELERCASRFSLLYFVASPL